MNAAISHRFRTFVRPNFVGAPADRPNTGLSTQNNFVVDELQARRELQKGFAGFLDPTIGAEKKGFNQGVKAVKKANKIGKRAATSGLKNVRAKGKSNLGFKTQTFGNTRPNKAFGAAFKLFSHGRDGNSNNGQFVSNPHLGVVSPTGRPVHRS